MHFEKVSFAEYKNSRLKTNKLLSIQVIEEEYENIELPKRGTSESAGYDFHIPYHLDMKYNMNQLLPTGIRLVADKLDMNYVMLLFPRSSVGFKKGLMLTNTCGVIDKDYYKADNEGHILISFSEVVRKDVVFEQGDRVVQGLIVPNLIVSNDSAEEERTGGLGSTGK